MTVALCLLFVLCGLSWTIKGGPLRWLSASLATVAALVMALAKTCCFLDEAIPHTSSEFASLLWHAGREFIKDAARNRRDALAEVE